MFLNDLNFYNWLPIVAGFCCLTAAVSFYLALRAKHRERIDNRLQALRQTGFLPATKPVEIVTLTRNDVATPLAGNRSALTGYRRHLLTLHGGATLTRQLGQAGFGSKKMLLPFFVLRLCLAGIGGGMTIVILPALNLFPTPAPLLFWGSAFVVAGLASYLPHMVLRYFIRSREQEIERTVPDMIDLLVLCVEAGLTLETALTRAVAGLEAFAPALCAEMKITLNELRILPDKSMALTNLQERTTSKSLKYLVLALRQSERYGTSITGALKAVALENRKLSILKLEAAAARMPALLSFPLIAFILPPVVAIAAGPGFILMMRTIGG